jgi:hypothetical protein
MDCGAYNDLYYFWEQQLKTCRYFRWTACFKVNRELIWAFIDIFLSESDAIKSTVPVSLISTNFQVLSKNEISLFSKNGGNAFGLDSDEGPLLREFYI